MSSKSKGAEPENGSGLLSMYRQARLIGAAALRWAFPERAQNRTYLRRSYNFESPIERGRHARTLSAVAQRLGPSALGEVLEVGCAEGAFTVELAKCSRSVTACDISAVACARAAQRCSGYANISLRHCDIVKASIGGPYDLILAMAVLEGIFGLKRLRRAVIKLVEAIRPGGFLVVNVFDLPGELQRAWWARWFLESKDRHIEALCKHPSLRLVHAESYPGPGLSVPGYAHPVIILLEKTGASQARDSDLSKGAASL